MVLTRVQLEQAHENATEVLPPLNIPYLDQLQFLLEAPHRHDQPSDFSYSGASYVTMHDEQVFHPKDFFSEKSCTDLTSVLYENDTERFDVYERWMKRVKKFSFTAENVPRFLKMFQLAKNVLLVDQAEQLAPELIQKIEKFEKVIEAESNKSNQVIIVKRFLLDLMKNSGLLGRDTYTGNPEEIFVNQPWRIAYCRFLKFLDSGKVQIEAEEKITNNDRFKQLLETNLKIGVILGNFFKRSFTQAPILISELQAAELSDAFKEFYTTDVKQNYGKVENVLLSRLKSGESSIGSFGRDYESAPTDPKKDPNSEAKDTLGIQLPLSKAELEMFYSGLENIPSNYESIKKSIADIFINIIGDRKFEIKQVKRIKKKDSPFYNTYYVRAVYNGIGLEIQLPTSRTLAESQKGFNHHDVYKVFKAIESEVRNGAHISAAVFDRHLRRAIDLKPVKNFIREEGNLSNNQKITADLINKYFLKLKKRWIGRLELEYHPERNIYYSRKEMDRLFLSQLLIGRLPLIRVDLFRDFLVNEVYNDLVNNGEDPDKNSIESEIQNLFPDTVHEKTPVNLKDVSIGAVLKIIKNRVAMKIAV